MVHRTLFHRLIEKVVVSLQVMSVKAIGIAIKLTLEGSSQVAHFKSWVFAMVAAMCIITQLNYLNKVGRILPLKFHRFRHP